MMIRSVVVVQQCQVSPVGSGKKPVARIQGDDGRLVLATETHDLCRVSTYPPHGGDIFVLVLSGWIVLIKNFDLPDIRVRPRVCA